MKLGVDAEWSDKFVRITNPFNAGFFIDAQPRLAGERQQLMPTESANTQKGV